MMNCKKGDLARVVSATQNPEYIGYIVRCVEPFVAPRGNAWAVDPPLGNWNGVYDFAPRPIANPGDDEVDVHDVRLGERSAA